MKEYTISSKQLFVLMFLFELGSAVVIGPATEAKQDAWIAILLGMIFGMLLFILYFYLYFKNGKLPLTSLLKNLLGKYFGYMASVVLRDFGELITLTILRETPLAVVNFLILLVVFYGIYLGVESIARTSEILFFIFILLEVIFFILVFASGLPDGKHLLPILENGWRPILNTVFPEALVFPFGETIAFTMLFSNLKNPELTIKWGLFSIIFSGIFLSATMAVNISVLGVYKASNVNFPLLSTLEKVNIGQFVTRFDSVAILILIITGFVKITLYAYATISGLRDLFKLKVYKKIITPVYIAISISSLVIASNYTEHIKIGLDIIPKNINVPVQIVIPIFLGLITFFNSKRKAKHSQET